VRCVGQATCRGDGLPTRIGTGSECSGPWCDALGFTSVAFINPQLAESPFAGVIGSCVGGGRGKSRRALCLKAALIATTRGSLRS
jgi:hypothetical protein